MGIATSIKGIRLPDEKWKKMKKVWVACKEANIDPPKEVLEFFNHDDPSPLGVKVDIKFEKINGLGAVTYIVKLDELPAGVNAMQFVNSW